MNFPKPSEKILICNTLAFRVSLREQKPDKTNKPTVSAGVCETPINTIRKTTNFPKNFIQG